MMKNCDIGTLILLGRVNYDEKSIGLLEGIISLALVKDLHQRAEGVARVIVRELVDPDHCPKCNGHKRLVKIDLQDINQPKRIEVPCDDCVELGVKWRSSRIRARIAGIPRRTWRDWELCEVVTAWALALEKEAGEATKKFAKQ